MNFSGDGNNILSSNPISSSIDHRDVVSMDSAGESISAESSTEMTEKKSLINFVFRFSAFLLFSTVVFFSVSFSIGFLALLVASFSFPSKSSIPSQCKIVSSSVDIRSTKVCDLGLLDYNAKNMLSSSDRRKFRCRYDYYWASVFKVEYIDHLSGQTRLASAEAPNVALPVECRPSFSIAWLTKDKFKVNRTYNCWYTSGMSTVSIYDNDLFSCQPNDPTMAETIGRYYDLLKEKLQTWFRTSRRLKYWRWDAIAGIAGVLAGFLTSLLSITLISILQRIKPRVRLNGGGRLIPKAINSNLLRRACFLVVYVSVSSWFVSQFWKRLGMPIIHIRR